MQVFIVLSALVAVALAKPGYGYLSGHGAVIAPVAYAHVVPGAPTGVDGRVVDTPAVAHAKAEHAAAHINERITLANEAVKSADVVAYSAPAVVSAYSAPAVVSAYSAPAVVSAYSAPAVVSAYSAPAVISAYSAPVAYAHIAHGAPVGVDGRVVDTPAVAHAKAEHAAAHINEKITLAHEAAKSYSAPVVSQVYSAAPAVAAYSSYAHPAVSVW